MKKNVRYIVLVIAIAMLAMVFTGCSSNQDANSEASADVDRYADWEIISVNTTVYGVSTSTSCIVVAAIDADNNVHTVKLFDHCIEIIESGTPYLHYDKSYGVELHITKADLISYLNN